jgi:hypothetical protein
MFGGQQQCRKQQAIRPQNISFAKFRRKTLSISSLGRLGAKKSGRERGLIGGLATHFR